ncbi:phosphatidylglycerol lysyltransferase domain-containing protein [Tsukamurella tyrosinosolvens]|uniref:phosphatidylglycerol lysyltransferase domain-containing protein n=1 Tax=Tsukamurella tyrosinosolvens TaxID=57704 RepID=UPI003684B67B
MSVRLRRDVFGSGHAETALIVAVVTVLLTRGYLALTGYPQIGGGSLHIAHALWGGALMMVALVTGWILFTQVAQVAVVLLGGVGFGLFLDEVGKFVTKDNDYFFRPGAAIMYTSVLVLVVAVRSVRTLRGLSVEECLANAAHQAALGLSGGLTEYRLRAARGLLDRARELQGDPAVIASVGSLLDRAGRRPDWLWALGRRMVAAIPPGLRSSVWVTVFGWLQVALAVPVAIAGAAQLATAGLLPRHSDSTPFLGPMGVADGLLFVAAVVTLALNVPALLGRGPDPVRRVQNMRLSALISTLLGAEVHFLQEQFVALVPLGFGLVSIAVFSHRVSVLVLGPAPAPDDTVADEQPAVVGTAAPQSPVPGAVPEHGSFPVITAIGVVLILGFGLVTGALWRPAGRIPWFSELAVGVPAIEEGRWWTVFTAGFFAISPGQYLTGVLAFALAVGWAERRLGSGRVLFVIVTAQVAGLVGAIAIVAGLRALGSDWAAELAAVRDLGCTTAAMGAIAACTATLRSPWRFRARSALTAYVVVSLLFWGTFADVTHIVAVGMWLVLGERFLSTVERGWRPRTRREVRLLAFTGVLVIAAVRILVVVDPGSGPLGATAGSGTVLWSTVAQVAVIAVIADRLRTGRRWARYTALVLGGLAVVAAVVAVWLGGAGTLSEPDAVLAAGTAFLWVPVLVLLVRDRAAFAVGRDRDGDGEPAAARAAVVEYGCSTMGWMVTWPGNRYLPGPGGRGIQAYQRYRGVDIALADPIGPPEAMRGQIAGFLRAAEDRGTVPCLFSVTGRVAEVARSFGMSSVRIAEDTLVDLEGLAFTGKAWQDVRTALNRAQRDGIEFRLVRLSEQPFSIVAQVRAISEAWMGEKGLPEMGFTLGGVEEAMDPEVVVGIAVDRDGDVHGVTSWLPVYAPGGRLRGRTLDVMRRRPGGFGPVVEFLIASSCRAFADDGLEFVSLSGAPLARSDGALDGAVDKALDAVGAALEPVYGFRSLHAFKAKFRPRTEPIFLCYREEADLPRIGLGLTAAYLPGVGLRELARITSRANRTSSTGVKGPS